MRYVDYLNAVIDRGIASARADYATFHHDDLGKLAGAIAGFEACRNKSPRALGALLIRANRAVHHVMVAYGGAVTTRTRSRRGWWIRTFHAEVDWVCNCVSAVLYNEGSPVIASHHPTARAFLFAASIVGVKPDPLHEVTLGGIVDSGGGS
jgi:hypothetical protein